jgi:nucleoside-diphosphate-sugar epimerase
MNNRLRICITGASGFVGRHLVSRLIDKGFDVQVLTRTSSHQFPKQVKVTVGDLLNSNFDFNDFVSECDVLINCAGELSNPNRMMELHVNGLKRMLEYIIQLNKINGKLIHFIQLSSVGVYGALDGSVDERIISETSKICPGNQYELTKSLADSLIQDMAHKNHYSYSILRPSNIVGIGMPSQSFAALLKAIRGKFFFYIGSRSVISTYIHVNDVVDALLVIILDNRSKNKIFNLSKDCRLSDIVLKVTNQYGRCKYFPCLPMWLVQFLVWLINKFIKLPLNKNRINALVSKTTYSSDKIRSVLGFTPSIYIPNFSIDYLKNLDEK